jgi:hypothetical protein
MEMTSPYIHQMNGVVERSFVTARDRAFAMLISARFSSGFQNRLWPEAVHTATKIGSSCLHQDSLFLPTRCSLVLKAKSPTSCRLLEELSILLIAQISIINFLQRLKSVSSLATQRIMPQIPLDFIILRLIKSSYLAMLQNGLNGMEG